MRAKETQFCFLILLFSFPGLLSAQDADKNAAQENQKLAAEFKASVARAATMATKVTIDRDKFGVPHVYGPTDASVVFGFTYARADVCYTGNH